MSLPLDGVRVVELAQYVAGPLCGVLLADLGAEVVKVEPPSGDGYRHVMPVAPGVGRYFVPLNRGKRSVVLDLKSERERLDAVRLVRTADVVLHNFTPERASRFGLDRETLQRDAPALVIGVVTSFGERGPLAGVPAYDLVAQPHSGLLTALASPGDRVPVRAGGIPMADLTAGFLLATAVLAALVRARESGVGEEVEVSLLAAALAVQLQDLVWLEDEAPAAPVPASREALDARAAEIGGGVAMNPYYRAYATRDGFLAVACLNVDQRRALLDVFGLGDPTVDAPDLVPADAGVLAGKQALTAEIERLFADATTAEWVERLRPVGVPAGAVQMREGVVADPQVEAVGLVSQVEQLGLGTISLLAPFLAVGGERQQAHAAPALGADTEAVLGELA